MCLRERASVRVWRVRWRGKGGGRLPDAKQKAQPVNCVSVRTVLGLRRSNLTFRVEEDAYILGSQLIGDAPIVLVKTRAPTATPSFPLCRSALL